MQCVREQSATFAGIPLQHTQINNIGLAVDHYGLNKFGSQKGNYQHIFKEIWEIIEPVVSQRQNSLYSVPIYVLNLWEALQRGPLFPNKSGESYNRLTSSDLDHMQPRFVALAALARLS